MFIYHDYAQSCKQCMGNKELNLCNKKLGTPDYFTCR